MRIIALLRLKAFWEDNPAYADPEQPGLTWYRHTLKADWACPADLKAEFRNASILRDGRVVFTSLATSTGWWYGSTTRTGWSTCGFIGTHAQYDEIDAQTI